MMKFDPKDWIFKSQRQRVSPFPNYMSMECVGDGMKASVGYDVDEVLYFITHNVHYLFLTKKTYNRVGRGVTNNIRGDNKLITRLVKEQNKYSQILARFCQKANQKNLKAISNRALYNLYADFEKI